MGPGAPAPQIIGAKAAATGRARMLLRLADLLSTEADPTCNVMAEERGRAAIQHMSISFKAAADILRYCAAHSERKRARLPGDYLAKDVPPLQEIACKAARRRPPAPAGYAAIQRRTGSASPISPNVAASLFLRYARPTGKSHLASPP